MSAAAYLLPMAGRREFGEWLDSRMADTGFSQARLAREADVSQSQLSRYRTGQVTPDPATIRKLAEALDADFDEMMILAGHVQGDERKAARTVIVRTDKPGRHRLLRLVADAEASQADIDKAEQVLRVLFGQDD